MKIRSIVTACLLLSVEVVQAATWISSSGSFQDGANWDTGAMPGNNETVDISGNVVVTDGVKRDWWGQNVIVRDGATLNCTASASKWQKGTITVQNGGRIVISKNGDLVMNNSDGLVINCFSRDGLHIDEHVKVTNGNLNSTLLNFGLEGSMFVKEIWNQDWKVQMTFSLDTGVSSSSSAIYSIETRTLVDLDHNTGTKNMILSGSIGKDLDGNSLTSVGALSDLTADASGLGKYYLYRDDTQGGDWIVKYVKATNVTVPEPSVAMMGIFGLTGLLLRRRR